MALSRLLTVDELTALRKLPNKALKILSLQASALKRLLSTEQIIVIFHMDFESALRDITFQQKRGGISNFPCQQQSATINTMFVWFFRVLFLYLYGLLKEYDKANDNVTGIMLGCMG